MKLVTMELDPRIYTIAWITPLEIEARAATCMLDNKHHGRFPLQRGDDYVFQAGDVCGHNVIIAALPAGQEYGTGSAAALTSQVKKFFPNLWFGLLVGVAAGLPKLTGPSPRDIRLGDVLVALPEGESAGLIAYGLGKETEKDGFQLLRGGHVLATTETVVRSAIGSIKLQAPDDVQLFIPFYEKMKDKEHTGGTFGDPGQDVDQLYENDVLGAPKLVERERRPDNRRTRVWYGTIGSGEKLMKNASRRDALRDKYSLIGIEMEAAGAMNRIPVGVIRGACDYGDERKSKEWQPYAAAMAAAYAKAVLAQIGPRGDGPQAKSTVKHVCYIPFRRNRNFTGREAQIGKLKQMLFTEEKERVAVMGLGGMGKTQIALELAYRVEDMKVQNPTKRYSVLWMPAQSMPAFEKAATELVHKFHIPCGDSNDPKEALRNYLASETAGNWLIILDNADDTNMLDRAPGKLTGIFDVLPHSQTGKIVITTRSPKIAIHIAGSDVIELTEMTPEEAKSFLQTSLIDKHQVKQIDSAMELLKKLMYLPLAVAQAAAYINMNKIPITSYLRLCNRTSQDMIKLLSARLRDETYHNESQGAVATTWIVSFNTICDTDAVASQILSFIQWIEPKAIPRIMLPRLSSDWNMTQTIGLLCGYGFLSWREDGETLDMHSLVHLALRLWSQQSQRNLIKEEQAVRHLAEIFPSNDWENRSLWRQYLPHALPLVKLSGPRRSIASLTLGYSVGTCLLRDGRISEAVEVLRLIVAIQESTLSEGHPSRLASQHELAIAYQANGQIKEAINLLEHVVAVQESTLPEDHSDRLASQHGLATAYQANGQIQEATDLLEHVVAVQELTLAEDHPDRLASQNELAMAYQANDQMKEAVDLLKHVVALRESTLAEDHPSRLASQHGLAAAYQANGQIKEAIKLLNHVVAVQGLTLANNHPSRLASQHELARAYQANGQIQEAIDLLKHVVALWQSSLAEDHPDLLASQHGLARAYQANGQIKEAIDLLKHVVALQESTLAVDHPSLLASQHGLARAYQANSQIKEAIDLLKHIVDVKEATLAKDHPSRLASRHELAVAYQANGQIKDAINLLEHIVAVQESTLPEDHPNQLASQYELATAYQANGQIQDAIGVLKRVVALQKLALAKDHPSLLASQHVLATAYESNGQIRDAIDLFKHLVALWELTLAEDHPNRLASQHGLAIAYQANGQMKEAISLLKHIVMVHKSTLAENHPNRLALQHELAIAYQANNQMKEAIDLFKNVVAVQELTLAEDHPDRLASQNGLAAAYQVNGQMKEAVDFLKHVVALQESKLVKDHPDRLASQHGLATAYQSNGQIQEATDLLEHVMAVQELTLVEDHPDRLASQHRLAAVYEANGQIMEAIALLKHLVAIRKSISAEDHLSRLLSQHQWVTAHQAEDLARSIPKHRFRWWKNDRKR